MKILISSRFHYDSYQGGAEHYSHSIAKELSKNNQVLYATTSKIPSSKHSYQIISYNNFSISKHSTPSFNLDQIANNFSPDIFHAVGSGFHHHFCTLKNYLHKKPKAIFSFLAATHPHNITAKMFSTGEEQLILNTYQAVTTLTDSNSLTQKYSKFHQKIFTLSPVLNPTYANQKKSSSASIKKKLSLKQDKFHTLMVSKLDRHHYYKGIEQALYAFKDLPSKYQLLIVGDGELKKDYINLARKLNISDQVSFLGAVTDSKLHQYHQAADLFILPSTSDSEGFGIVLIEAMACNTPTITTNVVGIAPELDKLKISTIIPPNDSQSISQAIISSQKKPPSSKTLKAASKYANSFNQKQMKTQLDTLYSYVS